MLVALLALLKALVLIVLYALCLNGTNATEESHIWCGWSDIARKSSARNQRYRRPVSLGVTYDLTLNQELLGHTRGSCIHEQSPSRLCSPSGGQ